MRRTSVPVVSLLALVSLAAACTGGERGKRRSLEVTGTGDSFDAGDPVTVGLFDADTGAPGPVALSAIEDDGTFAATFSAGDLETGIPWRVDAWQDSNDNAMCEGTTGDRGWEVHVPSFDETAEVSVNGHESLRDACDAFFRTVRMNFDVPDGPYDGKTLTAQLNVEGTAILVGSQQSILYSPTSLEDIFWAGATQTVTSWYIDYYVDMDDDGTCDGPAPGEDGAFRVIGGGDLFGGTLTFTVMAFDTASFASVCNDF